MDILTGIHVDFLSYTGINSVSIVEWPLFDGCHLFQSFRSFAVLMATSSIFIVNVGVASIASIALVVSFVFCSCVCLPTRLSNRMLIWEYRRHISVAELRQ
ncbi:uncharacterized protein LOC113464879 isoform X3 [Ceratina calcarata]|uniref:Uncharacterized protein LOC113464879 isoform X3 n=1 Tax=Ceratina calcarata TaxID=156304 RepID=A0AAJ7S8D2_9HYME|nr:uncharacterized protein LOC113464879 isoform X3 [Ceratina calcarata]